tara:strand:- start:477 stop:890 length:414 start_codon:yes stop_codon:yes gene_type:complete
MEITKRKKTREFTVYTDVEDVLVCKDGGLFSTLKRVYDIFKHDCENKIMLQPQGTESIFDFVEIEDGEDEFIEITFRYKYLGSDDEVKRRVFKTIVPYRAESNWHIQQTFMIMEAMYILKLNTQILTKQKELCSDGQ